MSGTLPRVIRIRTGASSTGVTSVSHCGWNLPPGPRLPRKRCPVKLAVRLKSRCLVSSITAWFPLHDASSRRGGEQCSLSSLGLPSGGRLAHGYFTAEMNISHANKFAVMCELWWTFQFLDAARPVHMWLDWMPQQTACTRSRLVVGRISNVASKIEKHGSDNLRQTKSDKRAEFPLHGLRTPWTIDPDGNCTEFPFCEM